MVNTPPIGSPSGGSNPAPQATTPTDPTAVVTTATATTATTTNPISPGANIPSTNVYIVDIGKYRKQELILQLGALGFPTHGTTEELRRRYYAAIASPSAMAQLQINPGTQPSLLMPPLSITVPQTLPAPVPIAPPLPTATQSNPPAAPPAPYQLPNAAQCCDIIRKWNVRFDGREDAMGFLERIEELRASYDLTGEAMLTALPELLKGDVLLWLRNNSSGWTQWKDFVEAFLRAYTTTDLASRLKRGVYQRMQKPTETMQAYVTEMLTMMRRCQFPEAERLDAIYDNMRTEYKFYTKRYECKILEDLLEGAREFEELKATQAKTPKEENIAKKNVSFGSATPQNEARRQESAPRWREQNNGWREPAPRWRDAAPQWRERSSSQPPAWRGTSPKGRTPTPPRSNTARNENTRQTEPMPCFNCQSNDQWASECPQNTRRKCLVCLQYAEAGHRCPSNGRQENPTGRD